MRKLKALGLAALIAALALWMLWPETLSVDQRAITGLAYSPDGRYVAASGWSVIRVWDARTHRLAYEFMPGRGIDQPWIEALAWSPDSARLAVGMLDVKDGLIQTTVTVFALGKASPPELENSLRHYPISSIAWGPAGTLSVGYTDSMIFVWDDSSGRILHQLVCGNSRGVLDVTHSPDGATLAAAGSTGRVYLWRMADGAPAGEWPAHVGAVNDLAYSPDGELLASAGSDHLIKLWSVPGGALVRTLAGHEDAVNVIAFNADGSRLASGSGQASDSGPESPDPSVRVWDLRSSAPPVKLGIQYPAASYVAFTPDGRKVANSNAYGPIHFWRVK
ncbi:MAG TPA: hypothetical protein VGE07_27225 [Herpetosiphonaceae bacterium]